MRKVVNSIPLHWIHTYKQKTLWIRKKPMTLNSLIVQTIMSLTHPNTIRVDVGSILGFLWNLCSGLNLNLIFGDENSSKFYNFGSIVPKITKQQTCTLHHCWGWAFDSTKMRARTPSMTRARVLMWSNPNISLDYFFLK
jgi:hypothetical protein